MNLYQGKILVADLSSGTVSVESLRTEWLRDYWGCWGLATRYYWDEVSPEVEPLSPENAIVIMTGPFTGTLVPMASRFCMVSKSPHTGTIFESNMGGAFGSELKYAGYDGLIIRGRSDKPVYIKIADQAVSIENAESLWGKGIFETEDLLTASVDDPDAKCLSIGPAGENLISYAIIGSDAYRQFGRAGAGALFGSKNLKGVVCRGTGGVRAADMNAFHQTIQHHTDTNLMTESHLWVKTEGTPGTVDMTNELGILPTRNFTQGRYEKYARINSDAVKAVKLNDRACSSCPMACGKFTQVGNSAVEGPEYETLSLAGSNCDVDDLGAIIEFNRLCDDLGIDTMSGSVTIGLAMEMTETGRADFDMRFGDVRTYHQVISEIAYLSTERGRDLSLGSKRLAKKYDSEDMSMEVKGLELPAYEPRGNYGMGLAYATSERGACHLRAYTTFSESPFDLDIMAKEVVEKQNFTAIKWSMCFCEFWEFLTPEILADLLSKGLGEPVSAEEMVQSGERIWNLNRLFNMRAGVTGKNDTLPQRVMTRELEKGPSEGRVFSAEDFAVAKQRYYKLRGWDDNAIPSAEKLQELGLESY